MRFVCVSSNFGHVQLLPVRATFKHITPHCYSTGRRCSLTMTAGVCACVSHSHLDSEMQRLRRVHGYEPYGACPVTCNVCALLLTISFGICRGSETMFIQSKVFFILHPECFLCLMCNFCTFCGVCGISSVDFCNFSRQAPSALSYDYLSSTGVQVRAFDGAL
jgi:hypothetical protein